LPYTLEIVRSADKYLTKLYRKQPKDVAAIENAIEALAVEPRPAGCRPLAGYSDVWRIKVRDYRICYEINDGALLVLVITISTREDVYDLLKRHLGFGSTP
jgi:mRNA interferase RelE/StbE